MKRILAAIVHNEAGVFKPRHQCVESSSGEYRKYFSWDHRTAGIFANDDHYQRRKPTGDRTSDKSN